MSDDWFWLLAAIASFVIGFVIGKFTERFQANSGWDS